MAGDMHWIMRDTGPFNISMPELTSPTYPYSKRYWRSDVATKEPIKLGTFYNRKKPIYPEYPRNAWRIVEGYNDSIPFKKPFKVLHTVKKPELSDIPPFRMLEYVRVTSKPHGMDTLFPVLKMELHLDDPANNRFSLGSKQNTSFAASTSSVNKALLEKVNGIPEVSSILQMARDNATALITAATNGYVTLHQKDSGGVDEIIISDEEDYTKAKRVWRWNVNGLGYSNTGYDGEFGLAMTMDGAIVADRITSGYMHADRIHGGSLVLGGYDNENGIAKVLNANNDIVCTLDSTGAYINGVVESHNPKTDVTLRMENGSIFAIENQTKKAEINTTVVYEGRTRAGINLYSGDGIVLDSAWLGVTESNGSIVWNIPKRKKIKVVTGITANKDSDGKVTSITYDTEELDFMHGLQLNP